MSQSQPINEITNATPTTASRNETVDPLPWLIRSLQRKLRDESSSQLEREAAKAEPR